MVYRISEQSRIAEFCVEWLQREPCVKSDFSPEIKAGFGLVPVSDEDFEREVGMVRLEVESKAIAEVVKRTAIEPAQLIAEGDWDGENWQVRVWQLAATGVAHYLLVISTTGEVKEFNGSTMP
jgi:hypothetical protein